MFNKILPILTLLILLASCCHHLFSPPVLPEEVTAEETTEETTSEETLPDTSAEETAPEETMEEVTHSAPVRLPSMSLYQMYPRDLLDMVFACKDGEILPIPSGYSEADVRTATLLVAADWYKTVGGVIHCDNADGTVTIYFDSGLCNIDYDADTTFAQSYADGLTSDDAGLKSIMYRIRDTINYKADAASLEEARLSGRANCLGMSFIYQRACLALGFPCEIVLGYDLGFHAWVVVHMPDGDYYADPAFYCATGNEFYNLNPQQLHSVTFGINQFWDPDLPPSSAWSWSDPFKGD